MDPNKITLESITKMFEYEKISRDIDSIDDINILRNLAKSHIKLYLSQQEVIASLKI
ncbi:MAG: hypothetical protein ACO3UU_00025 [Minisyncoccia bacterium]